MEAIFGKIEVKIQGLTPLLMDRLDPETLKKKGGVRIGEDISYEQQAENGAYRATINGEKQLYIPGEALYAMLIGTGGMWKFGKFSASRVLAGAIRIEPEKIPLGTNEYEVDIRAVNTKSGRILKGRAKLAKWETEFSIIYDKTIITKALTLQIKEILAAGGRRTGILSYSPRHKGWFGTFQVTKFEVAE